MNNKNKPFFVTILGLIALTLMAFNIIRLTTALLEWNLLLEFLPQPGPLYITLTGSFWALGWLGICLGIFFAKKWSGIAFLLHSFFYASYYWLDRLFFQPVMERNNALFAFIVSLALFVFIIVVLAMPGSRECFYGELRDKE